MKLFMYRRRAGPKLEMEMEMEINPKVESKYKVVLSRRWMGEEVALLLSTVTKFGRKLLITCVVRYYWQLDLA